MSSVYLSKYIRTGLLSTCRHTPTKFKVTDLLSSTLFCYYQKAYTKGNRKACTS